MQNLIRSFHVLDYAVGAVTVAYGAYTQQPIVAALGVAGLALAKLNFAERISGKLKTYFLRKRAPARAAVDSPEETAVPNDLRLPAVTYDVATRLTAGRLSVGSSRHSVLKTADALNHAPR